jgi:hypothetical protein
MTDDSQVSYSVGTVDHGKETKVGIYLGAGVDINHIHISASWKKAWGGKNGLNEKNCGILTVAYLF